MGKTVAKILIAIFLVITFTIGFTLTMLSNFPSVELSEDLRQLQISLGYGSTLNGYGWCKPCEYTAITSQYGYRTDPFTKETSYHSGVDLANGTGTPIYAAKSGTVIYADYNSVYGYHVKIDHGDGFVTLYGHMTAYVVEVNDAVTGGQLIGYMGSTGRSTGPHLHFTVYYNGETVEPMNYISDEALAQNNVEVQAYQYLINTLGLPKSSACGVLSNIAAESGFNLNSLGDDGTSYGLCQWHDIRSGVGRLTNLKNYCTGQGLDYTSIQGQLAFLGYELSTYYPGLLAELQSMENTADGAYQAAYLWCTQFERPADLEAQGNIRGIQARDIYWPKY